MQHHGAAPLFILPSAVFSCLRLPLTPTTSRHLDKPGRQSPPCYPSVSHPHQLCGFLTYPVNRCFMRQHRDREMLLLKRPRVCSTKTLTPASYATTASAFYCYTLHQPSKPFSRPDLLSPFPLRTKTIPCPPPVTSAARDLQELSRLTGRFITNLKGRNNGKTPTL